MTDQQQWVAEIQFRDIDTPDEEVTFTSEGNTAQDVIDLFVKEGIALPWNYDDDLEGNPIFRFIDEVEDTIYFVDMRTVRSIYVEKKDEEFEED